ncbi:UNVERIFIED_CONTAM: hypothetical protein IGO34_25090, partial [Salmonella enterica subsp. enterica serovar Weltevreden]
MAGITGQFGSKVERGIANAMLSEDLDDNTEVVSQFDAYDMRPGLQGGYGRWRVHADNHWAITGQRKSTSFFDDYYNRIYPVPAAL